MTEDNSGSRLEDSRSSGNENQGSQSPHDRRASEPPSQWASEPRSGYSDYGSEVAQNREPETGLPMRAAKRPWYTPGRLMRDLVIPLAFAFALAMFAQATLAKPYQIPSPSMYPTIQVLDRILANRLVYRFHSVERGDVVVFKPPASLDPETPYVKRVVGLPGDTVEIREGKTFVNGEEFVVAAAANPKYTRLPEVVPDDKLFVLGDNRNESSDSHVWGYVPVDNVIGRADLIYWPPEHIQLLGN